MEQHKYTIGQRVIYTITLEHPNNTDIKATVDVPMTVCGISVASEQLVAERQFYHYRLSTDNHSVIYDILETDIKPLDAKE